MAIILTSSPHSTTVIPRQEPFYNVDQDYWKQIRIEYSWSSHNFGLKTKQNIINSLVKEIHFMWISLAWIFKRFPFSFNTYVLWNINSFINPNFAASCINWFYLIFFTQNLVNPIFSQNQKVALTNELV